MQKWPLITCVAPPCSAEKRESSAEKRERPMIPYILAGQLIAISAASCCGARSGLERSGLERSGLERSGLERSGLERSAAALFSMALFSIGIASARRAAASIFAVTIGASMFAAIVSTAAPLVTVAPCCIVTAAACITRDPPGTSVAGMLFVVIVLNADDAVWDWNVVYALAAAFVTSTVFSRVYALSARRLQDVGQDASDMQVVANAWHRTFVH